MIFNSVCAVGGADGLEVVFKGMVLKNNKGDVNYVMGVASTSDSVIAVEEDAVVVDEKIGCSGKIVGGMSLEVALSLKVLDSYARGCRFLSLV